MTNQSKLLGTIDGNIMPVQEAGDPNTTYEQENDENGPPLVDVQTLTEHMARVAGILAGESNLDLIKDPLDNASAILEKFINDPQVPIFAVDQIVQHDDGSDEKSVVYTALIELQYRKDRVMTIIFVKKNPMIVADTPIQNQVLVTAMDSGDPYGSICAHVGKVLAPFFKSVIRDQRRNEHEGDKLVPAVQKSLNEAEINLLHLKQNIDIPDVELIIHPKILQAVEKAHARGTKPNVSDLGDDATDTSFLNALTTGVNRWTTDIQKVTAMDRNPDSGTSMQEVAFWLNLESALNKINQQREGEGVCLTLDVLNHAKRFHATTSFDTNAGLKERINMAANYNSFMRDLPLNDLISATDFESISKALSNVFNILKKVRNSNYPTSRTNALLRALSRDTTNQIQKVLQSQRLLAIPMDEFEAIYKKCSEIITKWDTEYEKMTMVMRQRKRDEGPKTATLRSNHRHKDLEKRLEAIREFRRQHEQLSNVIARVVRMSEVGTPSDGSDPVREVNVAYANVKEVDCLDLSPDGEKIWCDARNYYDERISRVETQLATRFREQLGSTRSAEEMFKIFSRFNSLFYRKHIKSAIREYQTKLIERVKEDIQNLQVLFEDEESRRRGIVISMKEDMPLIAAQISWNQKILKQLDFCMKRVAAVLGQEWATYRDGIELKRVDERFRQKLNVDTMLAEWTNSIQNRSAPSNARMLLVERQQRDGRQQLSLKVNFSPELIEVAKAVRTMRSMGFRPPFRIVNSAHHTSNIYPFAISLISSIRDYQITNSMVAERRGSEILVANLRKEIHKLLMDTAPHVWESFKTDTCVTRIADATNNYQDKVYDLLEILDKIDADVNSLDTCPYTREAIGALLQSIQANVDRLSYDSYSNQVIWTEDMGKRIEEKLAFRAEHAIALWTRYLTVNPDDLEEQWDGEIRPIRLALRITSQCMNVHPSLESATTNLFNQLYAHHGIVSKQPRVIADRHQMINRNDEDMTYKSAIMKMPGQIKVMKEAFRAITAVMSRVSTYVNEWVRYQVLWDLRMEHVCDRLENDLDKWIRTLAEIRDTRKRLDDGQAMGMKAFPVFVDYSDVQHKVSAKYEYWLRELQQKFVVVLGDAIKNFYSDIAKWRPELENQSLDSTATSDAVSLITAVQGLKKRVDFYDAQVSQFHVGERLLTSTRHPLPNSWIFAEHVAGEWSALMELLDRKNSAIKTRVANLQSRIKEEDEVVEKRIVELLNDWDKDKPTHGTNRPKDSIQVLTTYEERFTKVREDRENMVRAKNALDMTDSLRVGNQISKLDVALEELTDLRGAWQTLLPIYDEIEQLREKSWLMVQPRKLRQSVDDLLASLKKLPSQFRSYESHEQTKRLLQNYSRMNALIGELKSEALKERHWEKLTRELRVSWNPNDLTLGQVWEVDLIRHEAVIRQMLLVAQGELALEVFLKQVKEYWQAYTVDLVNYQKKTMLIRGWDELFNKLKEHINSLAAMKLSPYYKEFEEDALSWEDRLNKINALFDVWIDVQRRWVYLEGLFSGSADIATLLPMESNRFFGVSNEFLALMRRVSGAPRILDVVHIQGAQRLLERLADILAKIQKALGEYLERERSSFPRFYFVGDEDLLEIMGNSKDLVRIQKHLKKMFAGIMAIDVDEENLLIKGIVSREGEQVALNEPVNLKEIPRINDWLRKLENEMQKTLAKLLHQALEHFGKFDVNTLQSSDYMNWLDTYPAQIVSLAADIWWSESIDAKLAQSKQVDSVLKAVNDTLALLSESVLHDQPPITEFVHKRDVTRNLVDKKVSSNTDFYWLQVMRFYYIKEHTNDPSRCCVIRMANAQFNYGFEYLGIQERLVQTPLTDRCFLTMTQALHSRLGGSPFGPAGTGKTESVKALGHQLGRFVLVFNCDETFDFQAVGRILVGLCQVGAWGCFDEFNRLEERMLSAVSQQIQTIQESVRAGGQMSVNLVGKNLNVNANMAIFITMNPGYSGRSNLPDNLKQLFRSLAMTQPDRNLIAEVMLFSQGFGTAEVLAKKIVPLFILCKEQLSNQSHYDFGLRALKYVLVSAGNIKRDNLQQQTTDSDTNMAEQRILIQSVCETLVPKLVSEDITLLFSLLQDVFPDVQYKPKENTALRTELAKVCDKLYLSYSDVAGQNGYQWMEKVLQLYQITNLNHGLMLVGSSGCGKTTAWKVLLKALENLEQKEGVAHVIDAKAMSKDSLYGVLDPNTREWTDGLFTHIIRKVIDNVRGEADKRQWIIFDGDVDPEWVENLNSVLDDNKLLTLPNGERLSIPPNIRIIFEVSDLKYATLATVSRCGMVWFSEEVVTTDMLCENYLAQLRNQPCGSAIAAIPSLMATSTTSEIPESSGLHVQEVCANALTDHFSVEGLVPRSLEYAMTNVDHIMEVSRQRLLLAFFSMMNYSVRQLLNYALLHQDFPLSDDQMTAYINRAMLVNLVWSLSGDGKWRCRQRMSDFVRGSTTIPLPANEQSPIVDYEVVIESGEVQWQPWSRKVPKMEIEANRIAAGDVVVPTMDTVRHELLLNTWLSERKPLVLCGPPGSGKTMTLLSALRSQPDMDVINVNFSSSTTPELLLKTFDHYCEYRRTPNGVVLAPVQLGRWLVIFCDEINLPMPDKYGTQRVISFLRQLVSQNGFYRPSDQQWITLERIQFVGACNPPTDPGRNPLSERFLRHVPVVYVDYPGHTSLSQIYGTFNRAVLRLFNHLSGYAEPLTEAMVEVYLKSQEHFTQDEQPHYVYSPRELSRWIRGVSEAIAPLDSLDLPDLVRLWAHEALRLFQDRLVRDTERTWTDELIDETATKYFGSQIDVRETLKRPLLYSCWLTKNYLPVTRDELQKYVEARIRAFCEEELDVKLVLFDQMIDHILRIDRIYRQPQGHLLLIGVSGAGKTTLSRFVAWLNGLSVFQLKVHSKYSGADFDEDIRHVLRRAGCRGERICFIMDESNMLDTGFLERLNTLLANGEVPGLFEGDELTTLMNQVKENAQRQGVMLDSADELYKFFTNQVIRNLHVVFTMNPSGDGLRERAATSPALFNRCVLNWFGDWDNQALYQVGVQLTSSLDMGRADYVPPASMPRCCDLLDNQIEYQHAVINSFVHIHNTVRTVNEIESKKGHQVMALTPRHFLDFINHYTKLFHEKREELEEEQRHLDVGLQKIGETEEQVKELQKSLKIKDKELTEKQEAANAKLQQMLANQNKAQDEKTLSEKVRTELEADVAQLEKKKQEVSAELAQVEPAVEDAKQAVKGIKKQQLSEIRSMAAPPDIVKIALEAVCTLLGEDPSSIDWASIRKIMVKDDFITRILQFDSEKISPEILRATQKYVDRPDFEFEKVNRASIACGPMVKWVKSQILYSRILGKVEPLRQELKRLENDRDVKTKKFNDMADVIKSLEQSIAAYTEEYAQLIAQAESIKADSATVKTKVQRSIDLLQSLRAERDRWQVGCNTFSQQMETLVGDTVVSAAFLAYAGYYDQQLRERLFERWCHHLDEAAVGYRQEIARIEYLSSADEREEWVANGMPKDDLCMENSVMLKRFNRYPLVIDPSGQAFEFLQKQHGGKQSNFQVTSFLDQAFRKTLESALRFGTTLLVKDVENYDPILNPVLNREVKNTAGRILITIGDQDIDLSPAFKIFLITRDSSVEFPPDVCSRVTFVNFTITRGSLEMQCLNQVLRSERPDVDKKRSDSLKLQGEYATRLRQLEKLLLAALNESKGNILDDNSVMETLVKLKTEANEVAQKAAQANATMAEVEQVSQQYSKLAHACSLIYLKLYHLYEVHFLYRFSLDFLLDIFTDVLKSPELQSIEERGQRLNIITNNLFQVCYRRVSQGMLHSDKPMFALLLLRIYLSSCTKEPSYEAQFDHLLRNAEMLMSDPSKTALAKASSTHISGLNEKQVLALITLSEMKSGFSNCVKIAESKSNLEQFMKADKPEMEVPCIWENDEEISVIGRGLNELLVVHALRPDRLLGSIYSFISTAFGGEFMQQDKVLDMEAIIRDEVNCKVPILLSSATGYDASGRIEDLALNTNRQFTSIAIGSSEGFQQAEQALESSSKSGRWVLLKNVHLAPSWLTQLEKRLHNLKPHPQFRIILTAEINPKLPVTIIQASRVLVFEPATGLKANLLRSVSSIPGARISRAPIERSRLYFLMFWFHALVQERLRYRPLGWADSGLEFSDSDLRVACDMLDDALDAIAMDRSNIAPEKLPWNALRTLMSQCIYGGKIENRFDQTLLDCFLSKLFTPKLFDYDFVLINDVDGKATPLHVPEETTRDAVLSWIHNIKPAQMPNWIGLPNNAEKVLLTVRGQQLLRNMLKMSDDELAYEGTSEEEEKLAGPSWLVAICDMATRWLKMLPKEIIRFKRTKDNIKDPLFRFFEREVNTGGSLLSCIRLDLEDLLACGRGEQKQDNRIRALTAALNKGAVPSTWRRYTVPDSVTVVEWMKDFGERVKQLIRFSESGNLREETVWLGGLFSPEAYVTATRQLIAQNNGWSLEQLNMHVCVGDSSAPAERFTITGLKVVGAECRTGNQIGLTDEVQTELDRVHFYWKLETTPANRVTLPVYLYSNRRNLLFTFDFVPHNFEKSLVFERGVAVIGNGLL
ncbi:Dynein heavy chain, cytoplasmic [Aphelenchoides besseyi]|nr:Dynein heavy chain, cytoplasmic [Aphelenchoides besseyi]